MCRVFLDANVLFTAAHNPTGKAAFVVELAGQGHWDVLTSAFGVEEARRNLARKYSDCLPTFERIIADVTVIAIRRADECWLPLPEKDRPIFAAAHQCGATHRLTGDRRHFGPFMNDPAQTAGIMIQTVADFLRDVSCTAG